MREISQSVCGRGIGRVSEIIAESINVKEGERLTGRASGRCSRIVSVKLCGELVRGLLYQIVKYLV